MSKSETTKPFREYTREEMRDACRNNYNAGIEEAAQIAERIGGVAGDDIARMIRGGFAP